VGDKNKILHKGVMSQFRIKKADVGGKNHFKDLVFIKGRGTTKGLLRGKENETKA
jgi:hypothetical protein